MGFDDCGTVIGIRVDNLHHLIADALPDNGEWHALTSRVRKVNGELQVENLLIRREIQDVRVTAGVAKYSPPWYRRLMMRLIGRSHWRQSRPFPR